MKALLYELSPKIWTVQLRLGFCFIPKPYKIPTGLNICKIKKLENKSPCNQRELASLNISYTDSVNLLIYKEKKTLFGVFILIGRGYRIIYGLPHLPIPNIFCDYFICISRILINGWKQLIQIKT